MAPPPAPPKARPRPARAMFSRGSRLASPMSLALRGGKMAENLKDCKVCGKSSWSQLQNLCRLAKTSCPALGISRKNLYIFEVDYLCNYKKVRDKEYYLVKWRGYPESENTWEPRRNLRCANTLKQFHRDLEGEIIRRTGRRPRTVPPRHLDAALVEFLLQKGRQRKALQRWERELNARRSHKGSISVENEVDLNGPPKGFSYINEYKVAEGIAVTQVAIGCECKNCLEAPVNGCCPGVSLNKFAYNIQGQVRLQAGQPIYECNSRCRCSDDCPNRVVQRGISYNLCIFRTSNGRGWGVRTLEKIRRHSFVMEYVGEIITSEEAERRGQVYDRQGITYLFDLDYVEDVYTVDAAYYGNVSHFVNHSCNPNLQVYNVFIDNLDERLPRIAFFATRTIWAGEELTFDYNMQGSPKKRVRIECKCGTEFCRKYLF
ncbi:histone-lysine N-methyltransferase SUV39H1 isoform X2 [Monodelphis domestica]|uniref:histone-lysine N-methyltransferase SUV39H1 isoform X2 n=1 Tax=Monodelphis domestica TaxID=13616 RepID=UPI0024E1D206|nr:histone-lysine N-methyltransferase SUV39H1 isoform X2 [Monodelphis domestica]